MNPFEEMLRDEVFIQNDTGERQGPFKTAIADGQAVIFDEASQIQEGWKLVRSLPNGREEHYTILESNYSPGVNDIPPSCILHLTKDSSLRADGSEHGNTIVNISDSHGFQVGDHNVQSIGVALQELVNQIDGSEASAEEKATAKRKLRELLTNPTVAAVLGGVAAGLLGLLSTCHKTIT